MITVYPTLRQHIRDHKTTMGELAAVLNVSRFSLHLKLLGIKRWKFTEAVKICCFFRTHDVERLFSKKSVLFVRK